MSLRMGGLTTCSVSAKAMGNTSHAHSLRCSPECVLVLVCEWHCTPLISWRETWTYMHMQSRPFAPHPKMCSVLVLILSFTMRSYIIYTTHRHILSHPFNHFMYCCYSCSHQLVFFFSFLFCRKTRVPQLLRRHHHPRGYAIGMDWAIFHFS